VGAARNFFPFNQNSPKIQAIDHNQHQKEAGAILNQINLLEIALNCYDVIKTQYLTGFTIHEAFSRRSCAAKWQPWTANTRTKRNGYEL
jgi:hypothetical protein